MLSTFCCASMRSFRKTFSRSLPLLLFFGMPDIATDPCSLLISRCCSAMCCFCFSDSARILSSSRNKSDGEDPRGVVSFSFRDDVG